MVSIRLFARVLLVQIRVQVVLVLIEYCCDGNFEFFAVRQCEQISTGVVFNE